MTDDEITEIVVRLELLRGACNMQSIKKSEIAASIERFIKDLNAKVPTAPKA